MEEIGLADRYGALLFKMSNTDGFPVHIKDSLWYIIYLVTNCISI